jgi:hypothetical protein
VKEIVLKKIRNGPDIEDLVFGTLVDPNDDLLYVAD